jgi:nucleotide-binding universal stress UspA family protein
MGTHGKVGFQHLTGSYALKVVTNSPAPVIVVQKKSFTHGYKHIVFPVTVTTSDRQKVKWAIAIAKTFGATIHLFPKFESEKYLKRRIMSVVKQIKDIFAENNVKHIDKVSEEGGGNFAKQVIDYAVVNEADLIMIMTTKEQLLPMLSSWDEQIIFNSYQIPVICINPVNLKKTSWH